MLLSLETRFSEKLTREREFVTLWMHPNELHGAWLLFLPVGLPGRPVGQSVGRLGPWNDHKTAVDPAAAHWFILNINHGHDCVEKNN